MTHVPDVQTKRKYKEKREEYQNIQCYPSSSVQQEIIIAMDGMISKRDIKEASMVYKKYKHKMLYVVQSNSCSNMNYAQLYLRFVVSIVPLRPRNFQVFVLFAAVSPAMYVPPRICKIDS